MFGISAEQLQKALDKALGNTEDTMKLNAQIKALKNELEELKLTKKLEELEIKHLVKMKEEKQEKMSMAKKGAKSPAIALIIGMAKPKGKTMMNKGGMAKGKKC